MKGDSFQALQALVRAHGFYHQRPARTGGEYALHVGLILGGIALYLHTHGLGLRLLALFISTAGSFGLATSAHTASHNATVAGRRLNQALVYFGFTFFFGVSATYWWHKHLVVHHPGPNLVGHDDDIDLAPFFAVTEDQYQRSRGLLRLYYRLQWLIVPLAIPFNELNMQRTGWFFLARRMRTRPRAGHWLDLGILVLHWAVWVFLPMLVFPAASVIGFYLLRMALMGYAMFLGLAPGHFPVAAVTATARDRNADWMLRQTVTTVNYRTGPFGRLLCGGVEYHIEHHLFPNISPAHYPALSRIIEPFCRAHGYPYRTLSWPVAVWQSLLAFYRPKPVLARLDEHAAAAAPLALTAEVRDGHAA